MLRMGTRTVVLLMIALIGVLAGVFLTAESGYARLNTLTVRITAVQERQRQLAQLLRAISEAEASQRGLLLTKEDRYFRPYAAARHRAYHTLQFLESDYRQRGIDAGITGTVQLRSAMDGRFAQVDRALEAWRASGTGTRQALEAERDGFEQMNLIRETVRHLEAMESNALIGALASWLANMRELRIVIGAMTMLNIILVIVAGAFVLRSLSRRAKENARLQHEVNLGAHELSALSSHLQDISEREKKQLSRELHDSLGSLLVATKMDVTWLRNRLRGGDPRLDERWDRIQRSLEQGVDFKRRVVEQLRPTLLDTVGLFAALRWQFQETCSRAGVQGREEIPNEELPVANEAAIALFRVAQEAFTNIVEHARATSIDFRVEVRNGQLEMGISDNGRGIVSTEEATARGRGLASMRHRVNALGGSWYARRGDSGGTLIHIEVPLARILTDAQSHPGDTGEDARPLPGAAKPDVSDA